MGRPLLDGTKSRSPRKGIITKGVAKVGPGIDHLGSRRLTEIARRDLLQKRVHLGLGFPRVPLGDFRARRGHKPVVVPLHEGPRYVGHCGNALEPFVPTLQYRNVGSLDELQGIVALGLRPKPNIPLRRSARLLLESLGRTEIADRVIVDVRSYPIPEDAQFTSNRSSQNC